ncbi:MAG: hypothetical protein IKG58_03940 [Bacilli bacterium]|nr:hypothetical protein [Bacilli bacterium]
MNNINKISFCNGEKIINTNTGKYIIKEGNNSNIYNYLRSRGFNNFLDVEKSINNNEVYLYRNDNLKKEDKAIDLVNVFSMLHIKTTSYKEINLDKIKQVYEDTNRKLDELFRYYYNLQDKIESKVYMSPAEYLLIRNISNIYKFLNKSKYYIEKWYNLKIKQTRERIVLLHNNISLNNFIDDKDLLLKNWDKSKKDWVVYDFYNFYRNNYKDLEFSSLFSIYQSKYKFSIDEVLLFKSLVYKVWKIELNSSNYNNCVMVNDLVIYLEKTNNLFLEYDKKQQEADKDKFKEKNNNIESSSNKE